MTTGARALLIAAMVVALVACDNLERQRKARDQAASDFFPNGQVQQAPPPGTVPRGAAAREAELRQRPALTAELLQRGQDRYQVYCTPCHGLAGDGHGTVVARGFPAPPDFTEPRLRAAPEGYFVNVISNGYGQMYSYAARVAPVDRWAIAAYIRALQLSRHAPVGQLPAEDRQALEHAP
ncbi:cytochrome c [Pseudomonas sp. RIT-PI-S]|uniref:c-type cytochrome n=1 Tax=Pseudomonas sp. RIT-PI-S TaxID=3035295 RepID=UPI0021D90DDD|nr:cytochrome c [Pseudomonas sp. RIT-PI-S]